ncbi:MAG: hypothetical protein LIO87_10660 [Eubacterium sp.]|nr:hypothetical protein [Eubacterium sp.]
MIPPKKTKPEVEAKYLELSNKNHSRKCMANNMPKAIKDEMWCFLMMGNMKVDEKDIAELEDAVKMLCDATMQKNAGQANYAKKTDINWDNLDWIMWRIILAATTLVLSGRLTLKEDVSQ